MSDKCSDQKETLHYEAPHTLSPKFPFQLLGLGEIMKVYHAEWEVNRMKGCVPWIYIHACCLYIASETQYVTNQLQLILYGNHIHHFILQTICSHICLLCVQLRKFLTCIFSPKFSVRLHRYLSLEKKYVEASMVISMYRKMVNLSSIRAMVTALVHLMVYTQGIYQDLLFKLYSILQLKLLLGQRKVVVLLSKAPESIIVVSHIIFFLCQASMISSRLFCNWKVFIVCLQFTTHMCQF